MKRSLVLGRAPAANYGCLAYGGATGPVPASDLRELLLGIAALPKGSDVAIEVLQMRLHHDRHYKQEIAEELIDTGRELIQQISFTSKNDREDSQLGEIAGVCLTGEKGAAVVAEICERLKGAVAKYETSVYNHDDLLVGLFTAQPAAALDGLCGGDQEALDLGMRVLRDVRNRKHPLGVVPDEDVVRWCDVEPQSRYPAMADAINVFYHPDKNGPPRWASLALRFLEKAPDPSAILRIFTSNFMSAGGWISSPSAASQSNALLLDQLEAYPALQDTIAGLKVEVQKWMDEERNRDSMWNRERDERFE